MNRKKQFTITIIVLIINLLLDRITKMLAVYYLEGSQQLSFFFNTVILKYAENTGAFLGAGADWPDSLKYIVLIFIPILFCLYGVYYCAFKLEDTKTIIALGTIISGGMGNLFDRLVNDFKVVDFLNFGIGYFRTGILNIADMSVTFGVLYLIISRLSKKDDKELHERQRQ